MREKKMFVLTLNQLTTTIVSPSSNDSKWQMGFNSAFKWVTKVYLLTTTIVAPPSNDSKWQMGFNSAFKGLTQTISKFTDGSYISIRLLKNVQFSLSTPLRCTRSRGKNSTHS